MSFREDLLGLADEIRNIPPDLDERVTHVAIRRTYSPASSAPVPNPDLILSPTPKVKQITTGEVVGSYGRFVDGDLKVGPITPAYPGGGYTRDQLVGGEGVSEELTTYILTGQITGEFTRVHIETSRNHSWFLTLRRRRTTQR